MSFIELMKDDLNIEAGLALFGDEETYVEIAESYVEDSCVEVLKECFAKEDWGEYQVAIHGVKSTSVYIGADEISKKAKALEDALKENNIEYVKNNHEDVLNQYNSLVEKLRNSI